MIDIRIILRTGSDSWIAYLMYTTVKFQCDYLCYAMSVTEYIIILLMTFLFVTCGCLCMWFPEFLLGKLPHDQLDMHHIFLILMTNFPMCHFLSPETRKYYGMCSYSNFNIIHMTGFPHYIPMSYFLIVL